VELRGATGFYELELEGSADGYCSRKAVVTELAARLVLLTYNLWSLFTRLMGLNPGHHTEAIKSRRNFLFLAAQVVESGRQRTLKLAVKADWWQVLKGCYQRLRTWLAATAPQLESQRNFLRLLWDLKHVSANFKAIGFLANARKPAREAMRA
jgi:hypothetical protein